MQKRRKLLTVSSVLMLLASLPFMGWCMLFINQASLDTSFPLAGVGCFAAVILYLFSLVTAVVGLIWGKKPDCRPCLLLGGVQLAAAVGITALLKPYAVFVLPPVVILTVLYLMGARK